MCIRDSDCSGPSPRSMAVAGRLRGFVAATRRGVPRAGVSAAAPAVAAGWRTFWAAQAARPAAGPARRSTTATAAAERTRMAPVSYTHLDVYKRQ
ncbi:hypothetical protein B1A87_022600, partial [Arthrobacter sp. KBS0703]|uniref:hypothetical protein n=1 Tax=Arthrobacter sp. KBS0703 TaxID=1955698 RepID=UPI001193550F